MAKIKDMTDEEIRKLIPVLLKEKEAKDRKTIQLIQSRCKHRRMGVLSQEGHNLLYCQDCNKPFYGRDI